jgi:hypothetical protein
MAKKKSARKVTKEKLKKAGKTSRSLESWFSKSPYLYAEEQKSKKKKPDVEKKKPLSRKEEILRGIPNQDMMDNQAKDQADELKSIRPRKYRPNQTNPRDPTGIDVKKGGLILKVTKRGPLYKGKKSGKKKT